MRRQRRNMGYTLVEVMMVVAIVAIIAVLGILALRGMIVAMEMARLDSGAKQIYLVGQNRLVSMRESGLLTSLNAGGALGSTTLTERGGGVTYNTACSDDASAAALDEILPTGAIDYRLAEGGHYLMVFLEGSKGLVREVYYAEKALPAWDAATLERWRSDPSARRADRIGFYDGGEVDMGVVKQLDPPILDVENGEQLELQVTLPDSVSDPSQVEVGIEIEDLSDSSNKEEWALRFPYGFDDTRVIGGKRVYIKVLDKLFEAGKSFAEVCPSITPGADIRITATLRPVSSSGGSVSYLPSLPTFQETNSLFAGLGIDTRKLNSKIYTSLQFQISTGRHLQNLNMLQPVAGADKLAQIVANMDLMDDGSSNKSIANYFSAVQTENIDWGANYPGQSFLPINRTGSVTYYGLAYYEGNNYVIRGLSIKQGSTTGIMRWGLFAYLSTEQVKRSGATSTELWNVRGEVRGVRLSDLTVEAQSGFQIGGLAGWLANINVTDCHIYVEDAAHKDDYRVVCTGVSPPRQQAIGGLVGAVSTAYITDSSVSLSAVIGNAQIGTGGLVGYVQDYNSIIERCYVNIDLVKNTGGTVAGLGMLAGNITNYVTNCYAIGALSGNGDYVGGLIGGPGGGSGGSSGEKRYIVNAYAAVSYKDIVSNHPTQAVTHSETDAVQNIYFALPPDAAGPTPVPGRALQCELSELNLYFTGLPGCKIGVAAVPYDAALPDLYPYPGLAGVSGGGMIHYGDWPR